MMIDIGSVSVRIASWVCLAIFVAAVGSPSSEVADRESPMVELSTESDVANSDSAVTTFSSTDAPPCTCDLIEDCEMKGARILKNPAYWHWDPSAHWCRVLEEKRDCYLNSSCNSDKTYLEMGPWDDPANLDDYVNYLVNVTSYYRENGLCENDADYDVQFTYGKEYGVNWNCTSVNCSQHDLDDIIRHCDRIAVNYAKSPFAASCIAALRHTTCFLYETDKCRTTPAWSPGDDVTEFFLYKLATAGYCRLYVFREFEVDAEIWRWENKLPCCNDFYSYVDKQKKDNLEI